MSLNEMGIHKNISIFTYTCPFTHCPLCIKALVVIHKFRLRFHSFSSEC